MGWDAHLKCASCEHSVGEWSFTHNTSRMIYAVLEDEGIRQPGVPWWWQLSEYHGPKGAAFLDLIIKGLEADPTRFIAMNPENGWGSYDSLLRVLREMRDAVPEYPTIWRCWG